MIDMNKIIDLAEMRHLSKGDWDAGSALRHLLKIYNDDAWEVLDAWEELEATTDLEPARREMLVDKYTELKRIAGRQHKQIKESEDRGRRSTEFADRCESDGRRAPVGEFLRYVSC